MRKSLNRLLSLPFFMFAIAAVVIVSNFAVRYPIEVTYGGLNFAELLTWGTLTYPFAFLVTDLVNRHSGAGNARKVVFAGFVFGVLASIWLASPRIAAASGTAFLVSQMTDVSIFDKLRTRAWWLAPLVSSLIGSAIDTVIFNSMAFATLFDFVGRVDPEFAQTSGPFLTLFGETSIWVSWAFADFVVKILVALAALLPYRLLTNRLSKPHAQIA